ncbi:response regulator transcription factor [Rhizobium leguminosarum]|jgi:two-component system OmpR family response regulator|uniref:response regulator transcription factor n=1 Tax=Rhizobium TaxID=379 RepID=UPI00027D8E91|nr:response regulator transcription factor [Rhizobium leguminosarum]MBY2908513.1 response regulator transcription factor [Rhizobium leguminosarum]MBY2915320.1 response regulator transcription factor [Rhizobium leguminosarum]MBY2935701.1 response regulator transcription factor [Rhizobium leguminosarum]MBY2940889.1 response regulator transcription factor [Rhizobium leguminosarum]MBY2948283.1 response regulator transcription factor [Rhizobium leguminosarum]
MAPRILVVDDEPHIRDVICFALERAGLAWMAARNGTEAMAAFRRGNIDLIILDIGMPEMDGLEVCRQIRKTSGLPILFLSARDEEIDRILGLEIGGDDYVTKPFSPRELVARVKAILKRSSNGAEPDRRHATLVAGELSLDRRGRTVMFGENTIAMTALEFAILDALLSRPDMVFSREQLMEAAYGAGTYVADRTIDSHIRNIRAKFLVAGGQGIIATVHGIGFKLGREIGRKA